MPPQRTPRASSSSSRPFSAPPNTARLDGFLAADFVDHDAASGDSGPAGVRAKLDGLWSVLSDGHYVPLQVVAAGDLVTVRSELDADALAQAVRSRM